MTAAGSLGSMAVVMPPTRNDCGCGFLPPSTAWMRMKSFCHCQRFEIMRHCQQIHFGRQRVGGMAPIAAGEEAQLAAVDHAFDALLDAAEIGGAGLFAVGNRLRDGGSLRRIGLEGGGDIDPVERVQMIEVDHMVLHHLRAGDEVADNAGVIGNVDFQSVLDGAHAGDGVDHGADAADALRPDPGLARIAALQDQSRCRGTWCLNSRRRLFFLPRDWPQCGGGLQCG